MVYIITDDNCQYWKNLQNMTLSSPNYPKWYNSEYGSGCEWLLTVPEKFIIALEFQHFDMNNIGINNKVSFYDGPCDLTKELRTVTGLMLNDDRWVFSSSGRHMFITFIVDDLNAFPGFIAKIHYGNNYFNNMKIFCIRT